MLISKNEIILKIMKGCSIGLMGCEYAYFFNKLKQWPWSQLSDLQDYLHFNGFKDPRTQDYRLL